jgi:hypothetical protein
VTEDTWQSEGGGAACPVSLPRVFALVLSLAAFGCLGGQTGQPTVDTGCMAPVVNVPVDEAIRGIVPLDAARALEGSYTQPFVWVDGFDVLLPGVTSDQMGLTFTYDGGAARYDPCEHGGPDIQMTLDVSLRDAGLVETGTALVSFYPGPPRRDGVFGKFSLGTATSLVTGNLTRADTGTLVSGSLSTSALSVPLRQGHFP